LIKSSRSMNAIIFIEPAHFGQIKGSVSYISELGQGGQAGKQ